MSHAARRGRRRPRAWASLAGQARRHASASLADFRTPEAPLAAPRRKILLRHARQHRWGERPSTDRRAQRGWARAVGRVPRLTLPIHDGSRTPCAAGGATAYLTCAEGRRVLSGPSPALRLVSIGRGPHSDLSESPALKSTILNCACARQCRRPAPRAGPGRAPYSAVVARRKERTGTPQRLEFRLHR